MINNTKDLSKEAPRSPKLQLDGFVIIARTIDKCRATIAGTPGEYHFDCPLDNTLFSFKGIKGADFKAFVETGADDAAIVEWVKTHGTPKTDAEIAAWVEVASKEAFADNADKRAWLLGELKRVGLPESATLFDYLDADDAQSFTK